MFPPTYFILIACKGGLVAHMKKKTPQPPNNKSHIVRDIFNYCFILSHFHLPHEKQLFNLVIDVFMNNVQIPGKIFF
jgi:hypothetical protein